MIKEVLKSVPRIGYSVSFTTRSMRHGEENGRDYYFVSNAEFDDLKSQGELLEFAEVHGNFYGTAIKQVTAEIENGHDIILEIDVKGAANVRRKMPSAVSIFILPPSFEVLERRLTSRATENIDDLRLRLLNSSGEVNRYDEFEYIVINDDVVNAAESLRMIILAERLKRIRQTEAIRDILNSFDTSKFNTIGD